MLPRETSPYGLIQEELRQKNGGWNLLVACMMLNQTSIKQVRPIIFKFFDRWPDPDAAIRADQTEMAEMISKLGFKNRRSKSIIRMSKDFMEKSWSNPLDLHGIGKYASDSYHIFVLDMLIESVTDEKLKRYVKWVKDTSRSVSSAPAAARL